jgi:outer membrane biosynthesis protein TonB
VQNCEWQGSAWQCGQARQGRDTYTTTVKILDDEGNTLAITNQTRNNDAGYGSNAFKYEDSVSYTGAGSNQFYWEWEGVDEGSYVNLGGPNLLGAKLTMTYDDTVIEEETIEEIQEVIEQFEEWEQSFTEPVPIEEFIPIPIALEEFGIVQLEEEVIFEEVTTTLEEEFEEVEILQVFGGPEIVEDPEEEVTEKKPTETAAVTEELMEEQPEQTESTTVATVQEEPKSEPSSNEQVAVDVQDIQAQVAVKIKAVDKQLAAVNIIVADTMEKQQVDISSYYKQYTDTRQLYEGNVYEDLRILDGGEIYQNDNRFASISLNDPVREYQEKIQRNRLIRLQKEKELEVLRSQYAR